MTPQPKYTWGQEVWFLNAVQEEGTCPTCAHKRFTDYWICHQFDVFAISLTISGGFAYQRNHPLLSDLWTSESDIFSTAEEAQAECDLRNGSKGNAQPGGSVSDRQAECDRRNNK